MTQKAHKGCLIHFSMYGFHVVLSTVKDLNVKRHSLNPGEIAMKDLALSLSTQEALALQDRLGIDIDELNGEGDSAPELSSIYRKLLALWPEEGEKS